MLQALAGSAAVQVDDDPLPSGQARLGKRGLEWRISPCRRFVRRGVCSKNGLAKFFQVLDFA